MFSIHLYASILGVWVLFLFELSRGHIISPAFRSGYIIIVLLVVLCSLLVGLRRLYRYDRGIFFRYVGSGIFVGILALIKSMALTIPFSNESIDEHFRLSYANSILMLGMPPDRSWWILGGTGLPGYYFFAEYLTVMISELTFRSYDLSYLYLKVMPIVIRLGVFISCFDLLWAYVNKNNNIVRYWLTLCMVALVLFVGAIPYAQYLEHETFRQILLAEFIIASCILLSVKAIQSNLFKFRVVFFLGASLALPIIVVTKFPLVSLLLPMLGSLWLYFIVFEKEIGKRLVLTVVPILAMTLSYVTWIASNQDTYLGGIPGWRVDLFSLTKSLHPYWLVSFVSMHELAVVIATGQLVCPFLLWALLKKVTRKFESVSFAHFLVLFSLFLTVVLHVILGLVIRLNADTGGAEAYWLIGAGFVYNLCVILVLSYVELKKNILYYISIFGVFISIILTALVYAKGIFPYKNTVKSRSDIIDICQAIDIDMAQLRDISVTNAILGHFLVNDRNGWLYNAFCKIPTLSVNLPEESYGRAIKLDNNMADTYKLMSDISTLDDPLFAMKRIADFNRLKTLYLVRLSEIKGKSAAVCTHIKAIHSTLLYRCDLNIARRIKLAAYSNIGD